MGRTRDVEYEKTEFEHDKAIGFTHHEKQMDFELTFTFDQAPDDPSATDFGSLVRMRPKGFVKVLTPLFRLRSPKISATLMGNVKRLIESEVPTTP